MRIPRSNDLDLLRLILATSVVFQHCKVLAVGPTHLIYDAIEQIPAVPIFILIPGLLVTESFLNNSSSIIYFKKRILRILPAYLFVVYFGGLFIWLISIYYDIYGSGFFVSY